MCLKLQTYVTRYVLAAIDADIYSAVSDLIVSPPESNRYKTMEERLIKEY